MTRKFLAAVAAAVLSATSPVSAEPCDPVKLAALIDGYAAQPFSALNWRVLKGLGDPRIEADTGGYDSWQARDDFAKFAAGLAPDVKMPDSIGYDCRLGYPLDVLKARAQALGNEHPYIKQWLLAQRAVVNACSSAPDNALPPPLSGLAADVQTLQDHDRAYQEATRAFYVDRDAALGRFRAIGGSSSPHKGAARYMVANILANAKQIDAARTEARAILADPGLASVHTIAQALLGYIANIEDTAAGWTSLIDDTIAVLETPAGDIEASPKLSADYARALTDIDYAGIRAKRDDWWLDGKLPADPTISKAIVDASRKHPMVPWMIAGQTAQGYGDILSWQLQGAKHDARVAALVDRSLALVAGTPPLARDVLEALKTPRDDGARALLWSGADAAVAEAQKTCGAAPETAAAGFLFQQATRASVLARRFDEVEAALERYPFKPSYVFLRKSLLPAMQYTLGQGFLKEGRQLAMRFAGAEIYAALPENDRIYDGNALATAGMWLAAGRAQWLEALGRYSAKTDLVLWNFQPIGQLQALARDATSLTDAERALLLRAAWTRDYALGNRPDAASTAALHAANPGLAALAGRVRTDYPSIPPARAMLLTVLRSPRHNLLVTGPGEWTSATLTDAEDITGIDQYDHNDKNWWCPFEPDRQLLALRQEFDVAANQAVYPWQSGDVAAAYDPALSEALKAKREAVLAGHPMVKSIAWKQLRALAAAPSAPRRLAERAIAWGRTSRGGDGAPEALALAVRATRYGCNWHGGHRGYSKAAQELLKTKFGDTEWARRTPYYFDCLYEVWPRDPNATDKVKVCTPRTWPKQPLPGKVN